MLNYYVDRTSVSDLSVAISFPNANYFDFQSYLGVPLFSFKYLDFTFKCGDVGLLIRGLNVHSFICDWMWSYFNLVFLSTFCFPSKYSRDTLTGAEIFFGDLSGFVRLVWERADSSFSSKNLFFAMSSLYFFSAKVYDSFNNAGLNVQSLKCSCFISSLRINFLCVCNRC